MTNLDDNAAELLAELNELIQHCVSIELRIHKADVNRIVEVMEKHGFKYKVSWASMELTDFIVIDFWKKELLKK
ncbi:hypothetical protein [Paenibacillus radicis (ex Gao et al. 2016)]|uniref:Uncharacterized protein n=1 Tax=Paenibacillus radicis (ex Gao et al. 2016) TaxID=1737354 RepID=A0A917GRQ5_9BACL|nr:hypothetical protein [Paenibacillus radicis (ex Gao et al. 2016)]GGG54864.1 hypothetical protein GCM10010918_04640 [Paenibacillus radicis (ex Gao et al. 2016)]